MHVRETPRRSGWLAALAAIVLWLAAGPPAASQGGGGGGVIPPPQQEHTRFASPGRHGGRNVTHSPPNQSTFPPPG